MGAREVDAKEMERFRVSLEAAISRSSLRQVARVLGMSPTGLSNLLDGARPYGKTIDRLRRWYFRDTGLNGIPPEHIADEIRRLVATLPEPDTGIVHVLEGVGRAYAAAGMPAPEWVQRVRRLARARPH